MIINGERIRERRKELGLSQDKLSNLLGVSKVTICWYESGDRTPTLEHFIKLSEILQLSLNELVFKEVSIVAEDDETYNVRLAKKDVEIINEIKEKRNLYKQLYREPKRTVELLDRKIK